MSAYRPFALLLMSLPFLAATAGADDDGDCMKSCTTYGEQQQKAAAPAFKPGFETNAQVFRATSAGPLYCGCTFKPATSKDPTVNDDSFTPTLVCVASTATVQAVAMTLCQAPAAKAAADTTEVAPERSRQAAKLLAEPSDVSFGTKTGTQPAEDLNKPSGD